MLDICLQECRINSGFATGLRLTRAKTDENVVIFHITVFLPLAKVLSYSLLISDCKLKMRILFRTFLFHVAFLGIPFKGEKYIQMCILFLLLTPRLRYVAFHLN